MDLMILINGRLQNLFDAHGLNPESVEVVKIDEKDLSRPGKMLRLMKSGRFGTIYFACIDLNYQRFHFFMKLYMILSGAFNSLIIDESGRRKGVSLFGFVFADCPALALEIVASAFIIMYYYPKMLLLKWLLIKRN